MTERIAYFDYASTTPLKKSARDAMLPYLEGLYGNPSSPHKLGREARSAIDKARDNISENIGAKPREIIFTGTGSEANFLAITGAAIGNRHKGRHLLTSAFEHNATRAIFFFLAEYLDFEVDIVGIDEQGFVKLHELEQMIRDDTVLCSVMTVNNELGTIQDIRKISELCMQRDVLFHTDAIQAFGKIPMNLHELSVDFATASAHKFGGPKGVGFLYVAEGSYLEPIIETSHEFGMRAGTEDTAGIVGMSVALDESVRDLESVTSRLSEFKKKLTAGILSIAPDMKINGSSVNSYSGLLNVMLPGVSGEMMVLALDRENIAVSTGSACQTGSVEPSHVLRSIGLSVHDASSSLRISMGFDTTDSDVEYFLEVFPNVYDRVRKA